MRLARLRTGPAMRGGSLVMAIDLAEVGSDFCWRVGVRGSEDSR